MVFIFANRMLRSLHSYYILVFAISTFKAQPVDSLVSLVLVTLYEIPPQDEMLCDVVDARTNYTHVHVMPRHAAVVCFAQLIVHPV